MSERTRTKVLRDELTLMVSAGTPASHRRLRFAAAGVALVSCGVVSGVGVSAAFAGSEQTPLTAEQAQQRSVGHISVLATPAAPEDAVPISEPQALVMFDTETSRFVGEQGGVKIYVAAGREPLSPVCVALVGMGDDWTVSCGGLPLTAYGMNLGSVSLVEAGTPLPANWVRIDDNIQWLAPEFGMPKR